MSIWSPIIAWHEVYAHLFTFVFAIQYIQKGYHQTHDLVAKLVLTKQLLSFLVPACYSIGNRFGAHLKLVKV